MHPIFENPSALEQMAKEKYSIPPFLMMENAASALAMLIKKLSSEEKSDVFIFCGKGNNGADGLALARLLQSTKNVIVYCPQVPVTSEGLVQYNMAEKLNISIRSSFESFYEDFNKNSKNNCIIVDCIYGTGFHGELKKELQELFINLNNIKNTIRISCDVPSGLGLPNSFKADYTVTMGELKTSLFSDSVKAVTGELIVAELGFERKQLEGLTKPAAFLVTKDDLKLPFRTNISTNKGNFGHTLVFAGSKSGAAILSATAALSFGSGLTSLYECKNSNIQQFKLNPSIMLGNTIPEKTTCVSIGSGLGTSIKEAIPIFTEWFNRTKTPNCVIDADMFSYPNIKELLEHLNSINNAKIILTPHLKELQSLLQKLDFKSEFTNCPLKEINRYAVGKILTEKYPNITIVMKSAITFIAEKGLIYICNDGAPNLSKAGSGDVLAGMIAALLAQGYDAKDAAITAVEHHALTSKKLIPQSYNLTPELLISNL